MAFGTWTALPKNESSVAKNGGSQSTARCAAANSAAVGLRRFRRAVAAPSRVIVVRLARLRRIKDAAVAIDKEELVRAQGLRVFNAANKRGREARDVVMAVGREECGEFDHATSR